MTSITEYYELIEKIDNKFGTTLAASLASRPFKKALAIAKKEIKKDVAALPATGNNENDELRVARPPLTGCSLAAAWPGKYAVVVPAPRNYGTRDDGGATIKEMIRKMVPYCAAIEYTKDWSGFHAIFRKYAPETLGSSPALILFSGKGRILWEMHKTLFGVEEDGDTDDAYQTAFVNAIWSLFDDVEGAAGYCDVCENHDDGDGENGDAEYKIDVLGLPPARVCANCLCDTIPECFEGWDMSLINEYESLLLPPAAEKPDTEKPDTEKPDTEKPDTEKPDTEKPDTEPDAKRMKMTPVEDEE